MFSSLIAAAAVVLFAAVIGIPQYAVEEDLTALGGDLTLNDTSVNALRLPAPNLTSEEQVNLHLEGHSKFHLSFNVPERDGSYKLGPFFNHTSCGGCHVNDGRGRVMISKRSEGSSVLVKVALKGKKANGAPRPVPGAGEQLQNHGLNGKPRFDISLKWRFLKGKYSDGTPYQLRKPVLKFKIPGVNETKVVHSLRQTPPVVGVGLLEAIPVETLEQLSDPDDRDNDGISGRISYVIDATTKQRAVGRFGLRATHPTVRQQNAAAFFNDMGITNPVFRSKARTEEISEAELRAITFYTQVSSVPAARNQNDPQVISGKAVFKQLRCNSCHVMTITTGVHEIPELSHQTIHPFTDLLLHDMGEGLADTRPEFSASVREWKTAPLWAIGLTETLLRESIGYLHDGRARTLEEAILWHGGEASKSMKDFKKLPRQQREDLIQFLRSL